MMSPADREVIAQAVEALDVASWPLPNAEQMHIVRRALAPVPDEHAA